MKKLSRFLRLQVVSLIELPKSFAHFLPARIGLDLVTGPALDVASRIFNAEPLAFGARFLPLVQLPVIPWAVILPMGMVHHL
jgi:hypothetical protein